jgi:hypothetical protein
MIKQKNYKNNKSKVTRSETMLGIHNPQTAPSTGSWDLRRSEPSVEGVQAEVLFAFELDPLISGFWSPRKCVDVASWIAVQLHLGEFCARAFGLHGFFIGR